MRHRQCARQNPDLATCNPIDSGAMPLRGQQRAQPQDSHQTKHAAGAAACALPRSTVTRAQRQPPRSTPKPLSCDPGSTQCVPRKTGCVHCKCALLAAARVAANALRCRVHGAQRRGWHRQTGAAAHFCYFNCRRPAAVCAKRASAAAA